MPRPTRNSVAVAAGRNIKTIDNFYGKPHIVSPETTEAVMEALAETGYVNTGPLRQGANPLAGKTILYELPRAWNSSEVNAVFAATMAELAIEAARRGANFSIFTNWADFTLPPTIPRSPHMAELRRTYADKAAPQVYEHLRSSTKNLAGFLVNDPDVNDNRLAWLRRPGAPPHVVLGRPPGDVVPGLVTADVNDAWGFGQLVNGLGADRDMMIGHVGFELDGTGPPVRRRRAVATALKRFSGKPLHREYSRQIPYLTAEPEAAVSTLESWLTSWPLRAVVCDCDRFAGYVAMAAQNVGLEISLTPGPGALVLAGCDDGPERNVGPVRWLTLKHPYRAWAVAALDLLGEQITHPGAELDPVLVKPLVVPGEPGLVVPRKPRRASRRAAASRTTNPA